MGYGTADRPGTCGANERLPEAEAKERDGERQRHVNEQTLHLTARYQSLQNRLDAA